MELEAERNAVGVRDLDALFKPTSQLGACSQKPIDLVDMEAILMLTGISNSNGEPNPP